MLLKQNKENKLSANFNPVPARVANRDGNSVIIEAQGGHYRRNITHVKRFEQPGREVDPSVQDDTQDFQNAETVTVRNQNAEVSTPER